MKRKYAIVDIETTGGLSKRDKITEIGIVVSDGSKIIEKYNSLVNPERSIPANITSITGITNEMVADAPKFFEIAKEVIKHLEGCIFVAHNVRFDYGFIQQEFRQLGYTFTKRQLCTVVMSRQAFPDIRSYSLGNLIKYFNISVNARHRALDDAEATTLIFHKILDQAGTRDATKAMIQMSLKGTKLPANVNIDQIKDLPQECGVYYFLNQHQRVIYIGKSKNIQKRVISHFGKMTSKSEKLMQKVSDIHYEETGSELIALLKEAVEIKLQQPEINRAQKKVRLPFCVYEDVDKYGHRIIKAANQSHKDVEGKNILSSYEKLYHAKNKIKQVSEAFELCLKLNKIDKSKTACFNHSIGKCHGVCIGSEFPQSYNERALQAIETIKDDFKESFIILDKGRIPTERSIILVEEGEFKGYGYMNEEEQYAGIEEMKEVLAYQKIIPKESNSIIRQYIWKHPKLELIHL